LIKIGLIGCGNICNIAHIPAYKKISESRELKIIGTCDIIKEKAKNIAIITKAKNIFTDYRELLKLDLDLVDICTPTYTHSEIAIAAAKAGKDVICEKPIALTLKDAQEMINASVQYKKKLFIAHVRRFDPRFQHIRDDIIQDKIGKPVFIRITERQWLPFSGDSWFWKSNLSGGVIIDIGVHIADMFRWFFNSEPVEVFATGRMVREEAKKNGTFDHVVVMYKFAQRETAFMEISWVFPSEGSTLYHYLDIVGSKGKIEYSNRDNNPTIMVTNRISLPRYSLLMSTFPEAFEKELSHFLDCIEYNTSSLVTVQDAKKALEMCLAVGQSVREKKSIKLSL
jgi:predicted dehydrogenase